MLSDVDTEWYLKWLFFVKFIKVQTYYVKKFNVDVQKL